MPSVLYHCVIAEDFEADYGNRAEGDCAKHALCAKKQLGAVSCRLSKKKTRLRSRTNESTNLSHLKIHLTN